MQVISIINYKGGVGKTTTTANLGADLAARGYKVLLIDVDAQSSLTFSFVKPDYWETSLKDNKTIKQIFDVEEHQKTALDILTTYPDEIKNEIDDYDNGGKLGIIASHLGLLNVDLELATELSAPTMKKGKEKFIKIHSILADGLQKLNDEYDIVFIDCPPNFNIVTKNAIVASDNILIPAKPDYLSTLGIDYLIRNLSELKKQYNEYANELGIDEIDPKILGVIFTMVAYYDGKPINAQEQYIEQTKSLDIPVFQTYIRENKTIFSDAPAFGIPVSCTINKGTQYKHIRKELEDLTDEFIEKANI